MYLLLLVLSSIIFLYYYYSDQLKMQNIMINTTNPIIFLNKSKDIIVDDNDILYYKNTTNPIIFLNKSKDIIVDDNDILYYKNLTKTNLDIDYLNNINNLRNNLNIENRNNLRNNLNIENRNNLRNNLNIENRNNLRNNLNIENLYNNRNTINTRNNLDINIDDEIIFTRDSQNVHDSCVQNTIKIKYNNMNKSIINLDVIPEILNLSRKLNKDTNKVKDIINQIENRNAYVSNIDANEITVLQDSWLNGSDNIKEQIINELLDTTKDSYDKISIVCPTGVVSRILNSDIVDNIESSPRTKEILREEMLNIASKVRNDLEKEDNFIKLDELEQTDKLKNVLIKTYSDTYKDIIPEEVIQAELDTWIDHI